MIESRNPLSLLDEYFSGIRPQEAKTPDRPPVFLIQDEIKRSQLESRNLHTFEVPGIDSFIVVPKSFEPLINENPKTHENESEARYIIDGHVMENGHALFLSLLDVNGITSHHHHREPLSEDYWILKGEAEIGGKIVQIGGKKAEKYLHTLSNTDHQVRAIGSEILFIAQLRHAKWVPRELWHEPIVK